MRSAVHGTSIAEQIEMASVGPGSHGDGASQSGASEARIPSPPRFTPESSPVVTSCARPHHIVGQSSRPLLLARVEGEGRRPPSMS